MMAILAVASVIMTVIVIYYIMKSSNLREQNSSRFLLSLMFCDISTASGMIMYSTIRLLYEHNVIGDTKYATCIELPLWLITSSMIHSAINTIFISGDRLVAIMWPYFYLNKVQDNHVFLIIGLDWTINILYLIMGFTLWMVDYADRVVVLFYSIASVIPSTIIILMIVNTIIFITAWKQLKSIAVVITPITVKSAQAWQESHQIKAAKICYGVVITLIIFYSPTMLQIILKLIHGVETSNRLIDIFVDYGLVLNTIVDPIIYVFINKKLRQQISRNILGRSSTSNDRETSFNVQISKM